MMSCRLVFGDTEVLEDPTANDVLGGVALRFNLLAIAQISAKAFSSTTQSSALPASSGKMKSISICGIAGVPNGAFRGVCEYIMLQNNVILTQETP